MLSLINFLCLIIMCVYAQTQNIVLFIISFLYLTLATLGCISVTFSKSKCENIEWNGWMQFILSLIICGTVVYFTFGSSIGLWCLGVFLFSHIIVLINKK